ncbi:MAG: efflux RND transporter periplasmic adaptor subunit [Pseudomonadota bacterium]
MNTVFRSRPIAALPGLLLALLLVALPAQAVAWTLTHWDEGREWFVEAQDASGEAVPELEGGAEVTFLVHATELAESSPVADGRISLELRDQTGTLVAEGEAKADQPGIFPVAVKLPDPGHYHLTGRHHTEEGAQSSLLGNIEVLAEIPEDTTASDHGSLPKETQWRMDLATEVVERRPFAERIEVPGTVRSVPGARFHLTAPVAGVVHGVDGWPQPGQKLEGGDSLLELGLLPDSGTASGLALTITRAREKLTEAEATLDRLSALAEEGVVADSRVLEARRDRNTARAEWQDARERRDRLAGGSGDAGRIPLRAANGGRLESIDVTPGEAVQAGQRLATLLDPTRQWLIAELYPTDLERATELRDPAVRRPGSRTWQSLTGEPVWQAAGFREPGGTLPVAFELEGTEGYRPGMPVTVALTAGPGEPRLTVPERALIDDNGVSVVMVQTGGERFERRPVLTGTRAAGRVAIEDGLEPGDRVVTDGAWATLLAGRDNDSAGHGHSH